MTGRSSVLSGGMRQLDCRAGRLAIAGPCALAAPNAACPAFLANPQGTDRAGRRMLRMARSRTSSAGTPEGTERRFFAPRHMPIWLVLQGITGAHIVRRRAGGLVTEPKSPASLVRGARH